MIRRILSIALTFSLLFSTSALHASAATTQEKTITKSYGNFEFKLTETSRPSSDSVTLTYNRPDNLTTLPSKTQTEALLHTLGLEDVFVDRISDSDLLTYAAADQITGSTAFLRLDPDGSSVVINESEALQAEAEYQEILHNMLNATTTAEAEKYEQQLVGLNDYLRIHYLVVSLGNGRYRYGVSSRWLTMPEHRRSDSLGACAQDISIDPDTRSGYYGYTKVEYPNTVNEVISSPSFTIDADPNNPQNTSFIQSPVDGRWDGSGIIFYLPEDGSRGSSYSVINYDFYAHYEFEADVAYPDNRVNFNTIGSYDHAVTEIVFSPSLSISYDKVTSVSAAVGLSLENNTEMLAIEYQINYVPS